MLTEGSVQGSEGMYEWLAQDLAERGYVVLTYDVQGQGTSETLPHETADALPFCNPFAPAPGPSPAGPDPMRERATGFCAAPLLRGSYRYLEPAGHGEWQPVMLRRDPLLSFHYCSAYALRNGDRVRRDLDVTDMGCA